MAEERAKNLDSDDAVTKVNRDAAAQDRRALLLSQKGGDIGENNGLMRNAPSMSAHIEEISKKEKKKDKDTRSALSQAQKLLEQLNRDMERLREKIAKLDGEIEKLDEDISDIEKKMADKFGPDWEKKYKNGELDPTDPLVIILTQKSEERDQKKDKRTGYQKKYDEMAKDKEILEGKVTKIEAARENGTISGVEAEQQLMDAVEETSSSALWSVYQDDSVLKEASATIYTQNDDDAGLEQNDGSFFGAFGGTSVAENGDFGSGITSEKGNLELANAFAKAADPNPPTEAPQVVAALTLGGPTTG